MFGHREGQSQHAWPFMTYKSPTLDHDINGYRKRKKREVFNEVCDL